MIFLIVLLSLLILLLCCWLFAIAPGRGADFAPFARYDYAHRGLHHKESGVPENSLKAFARAVESGFGMEFDLQLTRDKRVVVHHDPSILRSCGVDRKIADMSLEELQEYRLFGSDQCVPLFSDLLKVVRGSTPLIIELKGYQSAEELCPLVMAELEGYEGLYCVESFDPRIVRWFKEHYPNIVRGQLMERLEKGGAQQLTAAQAFFGRHLCTNWLTRPHFEAYDFHNREKPSLPAARRLFGMQEVSWTIRSPEDFQKAKAMGNLVIFEGFVPLRQAQSKRYRFEKPVVPEGTCAAERSAVKN